MRRVLVAAILSTAAAAVPAVAEGGRENPFVPPPSEAEEQARQDERIRKIIWEQHPQMKSLLMQEVTANIERLDVQMRRRIDDAIREASIKVPEVAGTATSPDGSPLGDDEDKKSAAKAIPEGAKFISCVNGKAVYRDQDNIIFQVESTDGDSCSQ